MSHYHLPQIHVLNYCCCLFAVTHKCMIIELSANGNHWYALQLHKSKPKKKKTHPPQKNCMHACTEDSWQNTLDSKVCNVKEDVSAQIYLIN